MSKHQHLGVLPLALAYLITGCVLSAPSARAATVSGGALTLNLDRDALIAGTALDNFPDTATPTFPTCCRPSIYLEEFFDGAAAANRSYLQIRDDNTPDLYDLLPDEIPATGLSFAVNPQSVLNPQGRANQASAFTFDPGNIAGTASGKIGLGGVMRFRLDVAPPTNRLMVGDMALEYRPTMEDPAIGRSGWTLVNYISFKADAFEIYDVSTQLIGDSLTLNGNLGFGQGFDHVGATNARLNHNRIGSFSLQTTVVPIPGALGLLVAGLGLLRLCGKKRNAL